MKNMRTYILVVMLGLVYSSYAQENSTYKAGITADNLKKQVEKLCSKELGGREFASVGEYRSAGYIREQFINSGLAGNAPGVENFFQNYTVAFDTMISFYIENKYKKLTDPEDFVTWEWCFLRDTQNVEIVYAGFGLDRSDYSDYKNIDVKGKWAVVELNSPVDSAGKLLDTFDFTSPNHYAEYAPKKETAMKKGALGIIVRMNSKRYLDNLSESKKVPFNSFRMKDSYRLNLEIGVFPAITVRHSILDSLMGVNTEVLNKKVLSQLKNHASAAGTIDTRISFSITSEKRFKKSQNVIGIIKGRQENKAVIISAHYDDVDDGDTLQFFPGANDNASGTAAVIELAGAFSKASKTGLIPERTLIFAAFSGEEVALLGSEYYTKHPVYPMDSTTININLDCIGAIDSINLGEKAFTYVLAPDNDIEHFRTVLTELAEKNNMKLDFNQNPLNRNKPTFNYSDNASFSYNGNRALLLLSGINYLHTPEDSPEKLNYRNFEGITKFAFDFVWKVAQ